MTSTVFLALGSNMGDRLSNLEHAIQGLPPTVKPRECSPVYETPPWGYADQPPFLNMVLRAETDLPPGELLNDLKDLENRLGRQASFLNGPRLIDLDIISYEQEVLHLPGLNIPHPRFQERAFVLVPLADIASYYIHPTLHLPIGLLLQRVDRTGISLFSPPFSLDDKGELK